MAEDGRRVLDVATNTERLGAEAAVGCSRACCIVDDGFVFRSSGRRNGAALRWLLISGAAFTLAFALIVGRFAIGSEEARDWADSLSSIGSMLVGIAALTVSALTAWLSFRSARTVAAVNGTGLDRAAELLARKVRDDWNREIGVRRLRHPRPLRLRWRRTGRLAAALPETALGDGSLVDDDGRLPATQLVEAFRTLPVRQLIIRGAAGSGKSTLAMLFTVAAIGPARVSAPARRFPTEPVPVLLPLASWRPDSELLRSWAARWISDNYPARSARHRRGIRGPSRRPRSAAPLARRRRAAATARRRRPGGGWAALARSAAAGPSARSPRTP